MGYECSRCVPFAQDANCARLLLAPTLFLTARHNSEDVKRAVPLGAKDYLAKPFSESQLMARVGRLLRHTPQLTQQAWRTI